MYPSPEPFCSVHLPMFGGYEANTRNMRFEFSSSGTTSSRLSSDSNPRNPRYEHRKRWQRRDSRPCLSPWASAPDRVPCPTTATHHYYGAQLAA